MYRHAFALAGILLVLLMGVADAAGSKRRGKTHKKSESSKIEAPRQSDVLGKAPLFAPIYNWTGLYLGLNGGGTWGHSSWSNPPTGDFNVGGGLIGGTVGYNWQTGTMVFGAEADLAAVTTKGNTNTNCVGGGCETSQNWLGTARGRVGYAFDRFLPYLTAGGAAGDIRASRPGSAGASTTNLGWTAGGGFEFSVNGNWTAKAEYLYVDLGTLNCGVACGGLPSGNVAVRENLLRAGLNYRF